MAIINQARVWLRVRRFSSLLWSLSCVFFHRSSTVTQKCEAHDIHSHVELSRSLDSRYGDSSQVCEPPCATSSSFVWKQQQKIHSETSRTAFFTERSSRFSFFLRLITTNSAKRANRNGWTFCTAAILTLQLNYMRLFVMKIFGCQLTFRSSESNELIPLLDSLSMGEIGGCLRAGDNLVTSESDKYSKPSNSMLRAIWSVEIKVERKFISKNRR